MATFRGTNAEYTVVMVAGSSADPHPGPVLHIKSLNGGDEIAIYGHMLFFLPKDADSFRELTDMWITTWQADWKATRRVLDSLATDAPEVWSYWDFLYFSAITQFTVGYGDILPNSTPVRMIIVLQTCIAAALLIVAINIGFVKRS